MKQPSPSERIAAYQAAYRAANGHEIEVAYVKGWFLVGKWPSQSKVRGVKLDEYVARLKAAALAKTVHP